MHEILENKLCWAQRLAFAWIASLGILIAISYKSAYFNIGLTDFIAVAGIIILIYHRKSIAWLALRDAFTFYLGLFAFSVWLGMVVADLSTGKTTTWAWMNRGMGVLVLVISILFLRICLSGKIQNSLKWLIWAGCGYNLLGLIAALDRYLWRQPNIFFWEKQSLRLQGLMNNPNIYGGFLGLILVLLACASVYRISIFKTERMVWLQSAAIFIGLALTISRGSWLSTWLGLCAVVGFGWAGKQVRRLALPVILLILLGGLMAISHTAPVIDHSLYTQPSQMTGTFSIYMPHTQNYAHEFLRIARNHEGASDRMQIMQVAFQGYLASRESMLLGMGLGTFADFAQNSIIHVSVQIHNSFLWALVELGPVGFIAIIGLWSASILKLMRCARNSGWRDPISSSLLASFLLIFFYCLINDGMFQRELWLLLALAAASHPAIPKQEPTASSQIVSVPALHADLKLLSS